MNKKYLIYLAIAVATLVVVYGAFLWGKSSPVNIEINDVLQEEAKDQATTTPVVAPVKKTTTGTNPSKTTGTTILKDGSYLVSYTDRGFVPSSLEIKTGKSVHFVNNSNKAMSLTTTEPNSQVYGEFNQSKTVGRGGVYDFTFLHSGSWSYVNRNNQGDKGVIIVK